MEKILKSIKEILLIVAIFGAVGLAVMTVRGCQEPGIPDPGDTQWVTVHDTSVVILTDTLYLKDPSWEDAHHVASGTVTTDNGDVAEIDIQYNPITGQIGVGGHINYNPITGGNFIINLPVIDNKKMEEFGDIAAIFNPMPIDPDDGMSLGISYEPINFYDGRARLGIQAATSIEDEEWVSVGIRGAYRYRNVSVGAHISYQKEFDEDPDKWTFGPNVGFYF